MSVLYPLIYGAGTIGWQKSALDRMLILFIKLQSYCSRFAVLLNYGISFVAYRQQGAMRD